MLVADWQPESRSLSDVEHDMHGRPAGLQAGIEDPGRSDPIEPRSVGDERRLMDVAGDHHGGLVLPDPLHQLDVTKKALAVPTRGGVAGGA